MLKIFIKTILKKSKSLKCFLLTLFHKNLHSIQIKKKLFQWLNLSNYESIRNAKHHYNSKLCT